jgi:hypothetical protein
VHLEVMDVLTNLNLVIISQQVCASSKKKEKKRHGGSGHAHSLVEEAS